MGERRLTYFQALRHRIPAVSADVMAVRSSENKCDLPRVQQLETEMGERRLTYFKPCGISVLPKLDVDGIVGGTGAQQDTL